MSLSVIVASGGARPTLGRTLDSIRSQLSLEDECIVVIDALAPWGHSSRNRAMTWAKGEHLAFMDDDDHYLDGAFDIIRRAIAEDPDAIHVFRCRWPNGMLIPTPGDDELRLGNVSTQCFVVPNKAPLGLWTDEYAGDWGFISATAKHHPVRWHEECIALYRPAN